MVPIVVKAVSLNPLAASISFRWASRLARISGDFACSKVSPKSWRASGNCSSRYSKPLPTDNLPPVKGLTAISAIPDTTSGSWVIPLSTLKVGLARYFLAIEVSYFSSSWGLFLLAK